MEDDVSANTTDVILDIGAPDGKLTDEQKTRLASRLPEANSLLQDIEDRMAALSVAATSRWRPAQALHDIDENSAPVMGDEEYADFLALVESMAEHAIFRAVALFMGLPESVVDTVVTQALASDFGTTGNNPQALKKAAQPFVKRSVQSAPPLDMAR